MRKRLYRQSTRKISNRVMMEGGLRCIGGSSSRRPVMAGGTMPAARPSGKSLSLPTCRHQLLLRHGRSTSLIPDHTAYYGISRRCGAITECQASQGLLHLGRRSKQTIRNSNTATVSTCRRGSGPAVTVVLLQGRDCAVWRLFGCQAGPGLTKASLMVRTS